MLVGESQATAHNISKKREIGEKKKDISHKVKVSWILAQNNNSKNMDFFLFFHFCCFVVPFFVVILRLFLLHWHMLVIDIIHSNEFNCNILTCV